MKVFFLFDFSLGSGLRPEPQLFENLGSKKNFFEKKFLYPENYLEHMSCWMIFIAARRKFGRIYTPALHGIRPLNERWAGVFQNSLKGWANFLASVKG